MKRLIDIYFNILKAVCAVILAAMVAMVFGNVVLRYVFNSGITVSEELARWGLVYLTFIGAAITLRERQHLGMDFLVRMMGKTGRTVCHVLSHLLMIFATFLLLKGSWQQTLLNLDVTAPATEFSMGWFYGIGVFFALTSGVILIWELYQGLAGRLSEEELVSIRENEEEGEIEKIVPKLQEEAAAGRTAQ
jgi:TRAP-type C4-dicarboxylate transport system permease small subunit